MKRLAICLAFGVVMMPPVVVRAEEHPASPSRRIVASIPDPLLAGVLQDVLNRNPQISAATARTNAELSRAPQVAALPDPEAAVTAFVLPPETRVGPQRAAISLSQRLPGGGKRKLEARAEGHDAEALAASTEALRLSLITEARRLYHELEYLDQRSTVLQSERSLLAHFEELARARYASGKGLQLEVVAIQAEITRLDVARSEIVSSRAAVTADLNALRNRPGMPTNPTASHFAVLAGEIEWAALRERALASRPEFVALAAQGRRAETDGEIAGSRGKPDFMVGVTYAWVDRRTDVDVPDNGQDIFGLTGGITIPLWGKSVDAAREEATFRKIAVDEERRNVVASIDRQLETLRGRLPEIQRQLHLFEGILEIQSEQALRSAEAAYASGQVDVLSLLDSQRTLLDVRLAAARSRADLSIALAEIEGVIAGPLESAKERRSKNEDPEIDHGGVS